MGVVYPTVGANCVRPPNCHSEPLGEESRFARVCFVLLEILRFAQDDKYNPHFLQKYKSAATRRKNDRNL